MNRGKRILFLVVLLAILVFNFLFKDRLMTRAAERGLEGVFGAQADIEELHFQPLRGKIVLAGLAVTDADDPAKNLFELGATMIDLNINQLLRRRLVLEEVACRELRFDTDRKRPGRLAAPRSSQAEGGPRRPGGKKLIISAQALVKEHYAVLMSPVRALELRELLQSSVSSWEARGAGLEEAAAGAAAAEVLALEASKLRKPEDLVRALQTLVRAQDKLALIAEDVRQAREDFVKAQEQAEAALYALSEGLAADREALLGLWDLPAAENIPSLLLLRLLEPSLGAFSRYALRALEAAAALRHDSGGSGRKRRRGRDVDFPLQQYPRFLLRHLEGSLEEAGVYVRAELRDIASDMELWGRPATLEASWRRPEHRGSLAGTLDTRADSERLLALRLSSSSEQTRIALEGLPVVTGRHDFDSAFGVDRDRRVQGSVGLQAAVRAEQNAAVDPAGRVLAQGLSTVTDLVIEGYYIISPEGELSVQLKSSLDDLLVRIAASELADLKRKLKEELAVRPEGAENTRLYAALLGSGERLEAGAEGFARLASALEGQEREIRAQMTRLGGNVLPEALKKIKLPGN